MFSGLLCVYCLMSKDILKGNHVLSQVNSDSVCYLVPPLPFCRKDWLWKMPAEAMSDMQRQLHATSVCLVRCGMRACVKGLLRKQYGIHVNDPIDQENGDGRRKATSLQE